MTAAKTRYVIMMDDDVAAFPDDWPVVFIRDEVEELEQLAEYSRVDQYLPRKDYDAQSTLRNVQLKYRPDGQKYPGKIYSLRYVGGA